MNISSVGYAPIKLNLVKSMAASPTCSWTPCHGASWIVKSNKQACRHCGSTMVVSRSPRFEKCAIVRVVCCAHNQNITIMLASTPETRRIAQSP